MQHHVSSDSTKSALNPQGTGRVSPAVERSKSPRTSRKSGAQSRVIAAKKRTARGEKGVSTQTAKTAAKSARSSPAKEAAVPAATKTEEKKVIHRAVIEELDPEKEGQSLQQSEAAGGGRHGITEVDDAERDASEDSSWCKYRSAVVDLWDRCSRFFSSLFGKK